MKRRSFVAAPLFVPARVLRGAPGNTLNLAGIGVGGVGRSYLEGCAGENIAALCDVDTKYAARTFEKYPNAKRYTDYRVLLEKEKNIDGVVIGTPDHTHALIALAAMRLGKAVYCAKPLTRTIAESRLLARTAKETRVATQMSCQSSMDDASCSAIEWIRAGAAGTIREVHVWSDRPIWPQGLARPSATPPVPPELNWDLWLGPAPARPYHPAYHPFMFRGWYDFGTGALGDMGCHAFHTIVRALDLGAPLRVHATTSRMIESSLETRGNESLLRPRVAKYPETFPAASIVTYDFPNHLRLIWYDGGLKPPRPPGLPADKKLGSGGVLYVGDKGTLWTGFTGGPLWLSRDNFTPPPKTLTRAEHYKEWIAAAKGGPAPSCEFGFGAVITEWVLLGVLAQRTGEPLDYDKAAALQLDPPPRQGWEL